MKDFVRLVVVLFAVCVIAASALAFVNQATRDRIAAQALLEQQEALRQVFPEGQDFLEVEAKKAWEVKIDGLKKGNVFSITAKGYSGPIAIVFGMDMENRITGIKVVNHTETPGLGAKITSLKFTDQFRGKSPDELKLKKDDPAAGAIDAIAAATISSRVVTEEIRRTMETYEAGGKP